MRVAIHSDLREHGDQATVYREMLSVFVRAEELGFDSAWVRSYHFRRPGAGFSFPGGLPSPFIFLGAVAARTSRIRLGTSVVPLPLENVVRVAEDAAVLDAISGGRFELGVSNGGQPHVASALGVPLDKSVPAQLRRLGDLVSALDGVPLNGTKQELNPPAPGLSGRIWESALTSQTGQAAAGRGNGVLIGSTQTVPAEVTALAYHDSLPAGVAPRVGLVVNIHVASSRRVALAELEEDIETVYAWGKDWLPTASSLEEKATAINVHFGTPAEIASSIASFPAFPYTTELQFAVAYGTRSHSRRLAAVEAIAAEIAPRLGWSRC
ncbi:MAG: LLM class flavin-dependent oxidoreductase [Streptosporangiaceae bacterium]|jgi:alkanesulfonate monooxygenase SsuD/methylene tetrahydromethanopterin reductase-like flavin-dependent oxidoreductase (luciferase family)